MNKLVGISNFIKQNTNSKVFKGEWEKLRSEVEENFISGDPSLIKQGYRDGVILVSVLPTNFRCPVITLQEGDRFRGIYKKRAKGEEPRKLLYKNMDFDRQSIKPAKKVNIILYRRDVLAESGDRYTGADWDMIAIQALDSDKEAPMDPSTLMYNHFQLSGGTSTKMSPEEFEKALRESLLYWKDKVLIA